MNLSFWEKEHFFSDTDVVVIGSGIVGLATALHLKKTHPKLAVTIIERGILPTGASTKNAGFACFGSTSELLDDISKQGEDAVLTLIEKRFKGLERLRKTVGDKIMDYEGLGGYEVFDQQQDFERCSDQLSYLNQLVTTAIKRKNTYAVCSDNIKKWGFKGFQFAIQNQYEGQLDTGKMMKALIQKARSAGVIILNGLEITTLNETGKHVEVHFQPGFFINAKKVVVCTNGFARQLLPELAVKPGRSQVMVTAPVKNLRIKGSFHYNSGYVYFRNINNRILLGGGRNLNFKQEATDQFGLTDDIQHYLEKLLHENILPGMDYKIEQRWSGIMGLGDEKTAIVKPVSKNIICAVRMGGMGVAIGSLIGEEAGMITARGL